MKKTIKQLAKLAAESDKDLLFSDPDLYPYPTIPDDENNFISDYADSATYYDNYFVKEYGERIVEYDVETDSDFLNAWIDEMFGTELIYLEAWARLYYALHINYNPVYNVEEHTSTTYGEHVTDNVIGERKHTKGEQENTRGGGTDTSTTYNVAIDSGTEKESVKQTDIIANRTDTDGERIDTDDEATDTVTSNEHTDTIDRVGNIGVKSATELLNEEIRQKQRLAFFKNVFLILVEEAGAYYDADFLQ